MTEKQPSNQIASSPVFKERLRLETLDLLVLRTRYALLIAVFIYPAFWLLDVTIAPQFARQFFWIRMGVVATYVLSYLLINRPIGKKRAIYLSVGVVFFSALGIELMTPLIGGFHSTYYIGVLMALFVAGLFMPWNVMPSIICGLLIVAGYFGTNLAVAWHFSDGIYPMMGPFFFLTGTTIFMVFANWEKQRTRSRDLLQRMQIEKNAEELKALDEAKTRFFSNVSHELRSPLMMILGPLESLLTGKVVEPPHQMLEAMDANARRLLRQVNTLLDFAKMDAGKLKLNFDMGNIGNILKQLTIAAGPHARRREVDLIVEGLDGIEKSLMDPEKVETIAANLLSNALKFTPDQGAIFIRAGMSDNSVWFEIEDTGPGIPDDQLELVFERFIQVDDALSRSKEGTGLGLALVRELTLLHHGNVSAKNVENGGALFRVELPRNPDVKPVDRRKSYGRRKSDQIAAERTASLLGLHYESKTDLRTLLSDIDGAKLTKRDLQDSVKAIVSPPDAPRILLVEDNDDLRTFVRDALAVDFRMRTASDGQKALEIAEGQTFDLIISDVMMPVMDGYELCRRLRGNPALAKIPIILVTAKSGAEAVVEGLEVGADDYVTKPFELRELKARIQAHLRARRLERQLMERETRLIAIGQMTSAVVHDLKNPLSSIVGFSQIVKDDAMREGNSSVLPMIDPVIKEAKRLSRMISEVLDFARGTMRLDLEDTNLRQYLELIAEPLRAGLNRMQIDFFIEHGCPSELSLMLDRDRFQRVMENLVKNAQEALMTLENQHAIKQIWIKTSEEDGQVHIRVVDNGPGIPEKIRDNLFDPFATAGKKHGTGLGLATVRNMIMAHAGRIDVNMKSEKGGAAFDIYLPLPKSDDEKNASN